MASGEGIPTPRRLTLKALRSLLDRIKATRPLLVWHRYFEANGNLLAAGVGYFAFFSVFPLLTLAFTVFGLVLQDRPALVDAIANQLNEFLPGLVRTADNPDGMIGISVPSSTTLTLTGIIGLVTLLLAGLGWIGALRTGIRGIFGLEARPANAVRTRLRDLGVLLTLGLGVVVSAILTSGIGGLAGQVADWIHLGGTVSVTIVGLLVGVLFDTLLMVVLLRLLSGVPLPWANLRGGAILGAVALTLMKYFSGQLIARATSNPVLGTVAVSVGLLFWLNLMARVVLLSAAWAAHNVDVARLAGSEPETPILTIGPYAAELAPVASTSRAGDRVTLAVGAILGAVGALAIRAARRARPR